MLISFSGLDGAGKSTLISWLRTTLEARQIPVIVFHMNDHIGLYAYLRFVRDRVLRRNTALADASTPRSTPGRQGSVSRLARRVRNGVIWSTSLRRLIYPVDLMIFLGYRLWFEVVRRQVVIMDRYFYDTLVDVFGGRETGWIRMLRALTPTPDLPVFLSIDPEAAYVRKGEYTVEYLRRRWIAYRAIFPTVPASVTIPEGDLESTKALLLRTLVERLRAA